MRFIFTIAALLAPLAIAAPSPLASQGDVEVTVLTNSTGPGGADDHVKLVKRIGPRQQMAAWVYLADGCNYGQIPLWWAEMDFSKIDYLYIGPAGVLANKKFGFAETTPDTYCGSLITRLETVMRKYRSQKRGGKVIVSQWWKGNNNPSNWGNGVNVLAPLPSNEIGNYAASVGEFIQRYANQPDQNGYTGPIDGWDIDFESLNANAHGANVINIVRGQLTWLGQQYTPNRWFFVTASPDWTNLDALQAQKYWIDMVNMQTYDGGLGMDVNEFTKRGFSTNRLFFGACFESGSCINLPNGAADKAYSISAVKSQYTTNQLAGVHSWRLNSNQGDYANEGAKTNELADYVHNPSN